MRKALSKLIGLSFKAFKVGTPLAIFGTTTIFIKNKVKGAKEPLTLKDVGTGDERNIIVIGGGLSGLATAYYLTQ